MTLREQLELAIEQAILALDMLDAEHEDREPEEDADEWADYPAGDQLPGDPEDAEPTEDDEPSAGWIWQERDAA